MARFHGEIGYADSVEDPPDSGVWVDKITEAGYYGEILRNIRHLDHTQKVNDDVSVAHSISVVADQFAIEHFMKIKYVRWAGVRWDVTSVTVESPRLILDLGSVYN